MPARVHDVESGGLDPDDAAAGIERALVRGAVDADREPAHDDDARTGERGAELTGVGQPVRRRRAGADHRDPWSFEDVGARAFGEQHRGSVVDALVDRVARTTDVEHAACRGASSTGAIAVSACVGCGRPGARDLAAAAARRRRARPRLRPRAPRRARPPASASGSACGAGAPGWCGGARRASPPRAGRTSRRVGLTAPLLASDAARTMCSAEMSGASARSASVRATRRTRAAPRPVNVVLLDHDPPHLGGVVARARRTGRAHPPGTCALRRHGVPRSRTRWRVDRGEHAGGDDLGRLARARRRAAARRPASRRSKRSSSGAERRRR